MLWAERIDQLPYRRHARMHRVGWTVNNVRSFIVDTLRFGGGTWVSGIYGAVAEFCVGEGEPVDLDIGEAVVNASTSRGAISFRLSEHVRALAFGSSQDRRPDTAAPFLNAKKIVLMQDNLNTQGQMRPI
jgi:hypothetical protein